MVGYFGCDFFSTPLRNEEFCLFDRNIVLFRCDRGKAKLVWIHAEEGIKSLRIRHNSNVEFAILYGGTPRLINLDQIEHRRYLPRVSWRTKLTIQPPSEWTQIQVWAWMVVAAFAAYPTIAFIRGPLRRWRRRRKGLCIRCGYNLEGNVSGVCSECG